MEMCAAVEKPNGKDLIPHKEFCLTASKLEILFIYIAKLHLQKGLLCRFEKVHPPLFTETDHVQNLGSLRGIIRSFLKIHTVSI